MYRLALLLLSVAALATAQPAAAAPPATLTGVIDEALATGSDALLPAILSVPLGLSNDESATPVHELVAQTGHITHRFCVSISHRHELLMLNVEEDRGVTNAYLLSAAGKLRKAVTQAGQGAAVTIPRAHAAAAFLAERDYWSDRLRPRTATH